GTARDKGDIRASADTASPCGIDCKTARPGNCHHGLPGGGNDHDCGGNTLERHSLVCSDWDTCARYRMELSAAHVSEKPGTQFSRPGKRSAEKRLSPYPEQDSSRFGRGFRKRVHARDPDPAPFSPGAAYRLRFFCLCRGVGTARIGHCPDSLSCPHPL